MSYCRWSSDNFKCDIYAYESDGGYQIHIASVRILGDVPPLPNILTVSFAEWDEAYRRQIDFLTTAQREPIELPHAGESFVADDLESFEAKLLELRELGYHIPDYVFDQIIAEIEDETE